MDKQWWEPEIGVKLQNRFDIAVEDANTGQTKQTATANNIILDSLWARLFSQQVFSGWIHFGSGTGTPSVDRTTLFQFLGQRFMIGNSVIEYNEPVVSATAHIRLEPAEFIGSVFSEVGMAHGMSANTLTTHALLRDSEGNPMSFVKGELDVVTITATIYGTISLPSNCRLVRRLAQGGFGNTALLPSVWPISNSLFRLLSGRGVLASADRNIRTGAVSMGSNTEPIAVRSIMGEQRGLLSSSAIAIRGDAASRRLIYVPAGTQNEPVIVDRVRFGTLASNGHIGEIGVDNLVNVSLPNQQQGLHHQPNVTITTEVAGTEERRHFLLPDRNVGIGGFAQASLDGNVVIRSGVTDIPTTAFKFRRLNSQNRNVANVGVSPSGNAIVIDTSGGWRVSTRPSGSTAQHVWRPTPIAAITGTWGIFASDRIVLRSRETFAINEDFSDATRTVLPETLGTPNLSRHSKAYIGSLNIGGTGRSLGVRTPTDGYQSTEVRSVPVSISGVHTRLSPDAEGKYLFAGSTTTNASMFERISGTDGYQEIAGVFDGLPSGVTLNGGEFTHDGNWLLLHGVAATRIFIYRLVEGAWVDSSSLLTYRRGAANSAVHTERLEFMVSVSGHGVTVFRFIDNRWIGVLVTPTHNTNVTVGRISDNLGLMADAQTTEAQWNSVVVLPDPIPHGEHIGTSYSISGILKTETNVLDFSFGLQF